jgi:hypothetical protein
LQKRLRAVRRGYLDLIPPVAPLDRATEGLAALEAKALKAKKKKDAKEKDAKEKDAKEKDAEEGILKNTGSGSIKT